MYFLLYEQNVEPLPHIYFNIKLKTYTFIKLVGNITAIKKSSCDELKAQTDTKTKKLSKALLKLNWNIFSSCEIRLLYPFSSSASYHKLLKVWKEDDDGDSYSLMEKLEE